MTQHNTPNKYEGVSSAATFMRIDRLTDIPGMIKNRCLEDLEYSYSVFVDKVREEEAIRLVDYNYHVINNQAIEWRG